MNGSPSVRVALNPRADGSMSPEYTTDYEITRHELEEADELCHGNWIKSSI